jgi:hypothetical protein
MVDHELESFKNIDIRAYAAGQGYQHDPKDASAMRHPDGDKIIIKRNAADGHYVYFSVHNDRDHGTIIDFVQMRRALSLGAVRKELRAFMGRPPVTPAPYSALRATRKDRISVEIEFAKMQDAQRHPYLEHERGVAPELLQRERFEGRVRIDLRGNAVFPHFDEHGLCGFEIKGPGYTGFSTGGTKGLFMSNTLLDDAAFVLCESGIETLSYAQLFPSERARYASVGGKLNPMQPELIRAAISHMPAGAEIVAGMNADKAGRDLAEAVRRAVELSGREDLRFRIHEPSGFKDWNDQVRGRRAPIAPKFREERPLVK